MMTWQHPSSAALPAKQRPETTPTSGTFPLERAEQREGLGVEPGHDGHVRVAGAATAAFGEEDDREAQAFHELEEAVLLAMVHLALGAGQDGIIVREDGAARPFSVEEVSVDPADAGDETVGRRVGDEVVGGPARPLGRDDEAAVLLEAVRVAQILDVLSCRPSPTRVPALGRRRPAVVERGRDALPQLGQLGTYDAPGRWGRPRRRRRRRRRPRRRSRRLVDPHEHVPGLHRVAGRDSDRVHRPGRRCLEDVLHLHGLDHEEDGTGRDHIARSDCHAEHGAGEGHRELGQPSHRGVRTSKPTSVPQVLR